MTTENTLQRRYNARRWSAHSVITLTGCWIPLNNGTIINSLSLTTGFWQI